MYINTKCIVLFNTYLQNTTKWKCQILLRKFAAWKIPSIRSLLFFSGTHKKTVLSFVSVLLEFNWLKLVYCQYMSTYLEKYTHYTKVQHISPPVHPFWPMFKFLGHSSGFLHTLWLWLQFSFSIGTEIILLIIERYLICELTHVKNCHWF